MSWNISFIGTPAAIVNALKEQTDKFSFEDSKKEYEKVLPTLVTLVEANYDNHNGHQMGLHLMANGHTHSENGEPKHASLNVELKPLPGIVVV